MEKLNCKSLMTGDWAVYNGDVEYIDPIRIEGMDIATDILITSDREDVGFEGVESIPLTLKILDKNGFRTGIYGNIVMMEKGVSFPLIKGYEGDFRWTYRGEHIIKIKLVHEIQHAPRLCEIKKGIEL